MNELDYEEEKRYVSFCGVYCRDCDSFTGRRQALAQEALRAIDERKEEFEKLFTKEVRDLITQFLVVRASWRCPGCRALLDDLTTHICRIRQCCSNKGLDLCSECKEFPCEMLLNYPPVRRLKGVESLKEIREKGLERWLNERLRKAPKCEAQD